MSQQITDKEKVNNYVLFVRLSVPAKMELVTVGET
jgi:hypothetical protein